VKLALRFAATLWSSRENKSSASTESIGCRLCTPERTVHYNQDPIYKCHLQMPGTGRRRI
jgi:hypothetical protein